MQLGPELHVGEPPAPEPHEQAVPTLVGDRLPERPNDGWTELGGGRQGCVYLPWLTPVLLKAGSEFLKPTIWVSPSRVVALGGNVTIRCEGRQRSMEFFLRKPSYPKPNISVSLGGTVVVRCWGQHQDVRFVLNKERRHFPPVDSDGFEAVFSSSNVHRDLGGSYSCSYHSKSEPFAVSYPSDPVELVVRGEGPALASPFPAPPPPARPSPGLGDNGTLRARLCPDRQHGGSYSCSYRPRSEPFVSSQPSDTVELVVAGEGPSSVSPLPAPPSEGQHPDGMLRAKVPVLRVPLPLSVLLRTRVGVLGLLPSCSPGGQSSGRELTQPSLERRRLPPARAARGQVLGLGGIY
uniref:Ig-like domain-containing protein n=1 Tax=Terrapene triunguis TaxID=2587831 RepID=A0A674JX35_9SAUR